MPNTIRTLAALLASLVVTGCATAPERQAVAIGQAGWTYARSVYENPINRPVSHVSSLGSLALKSTGGFLRRATVNNIGMPALSGDIPDVALAEPMNLDEFEDVLDRVTGTRSDTGRIQFLVDGEEYFSRLEQAVSEAQQSIDIRTFIFDNDDFAVAFADQLKARSSDVPVRVMIDSLGNLLALQVDPESNPENHEYPVSMNLHLEDDSSVRVRKMTNPWLTSDHVKTSIIDRRIAFVGGMNIGREYRYEWHDLMMEVTGPVVDQLQFKSDKAWARAGLLGDVAYVARAMRGKSEDADRGGYAVRILQTKNFSSQIYKAQIAAIKHAQSYILIENAYFSDDRTIYELAKARRRGVDVRVIVPAAGNHGTLNASNRVTINTLLEHGIRVYEYPGMSHVKAAVFDGWACVGSANLDKLSLKVNKELNLATSDPETVNSLLDRVFLPDLEASREIVRPVVVTVADRMIEKLVDEAL